MALPSSVESAFRKVRDAADVLGKACYNAEQPGVKADEDRKKEAQQKITEAAQALKSAAEKLADAARRVG